jgi:hypothetical protein
MGRQRTWSASGTPLCSLRTIFSGKGASRRALGRMLEQSAVIVTPDTILRWHRELVARQLGNRLIEPGRKWAARQVTWRAGSDWAACSVTAAGKRPEFPVQ